MSVVAMIVVGVLGRPLGGEPPTARQTRPQQKLELLVGTWNYVGKDLTSPFGPGGDAVVSLMCEWLRGGYFVVCHENGRLGATAFSKLEVYGYSPETESYTYSSFDSGGASQSQLCTIDSVTLRCQGEDRTAAGQPVRTRVVMSGEDGSSDRFAFTWEYSTDGKEWSTGGKGRVTRRR